MRGTILKGLNLTANYAYTEAKVIKVAKDVTAVKEGDIVPGYAKHTANSWLSYKLQGGALKRLGFSAGGIYLGDRATYWERAPNPGKELEEYFKLDAGMLTRVASFLS